MDFMKVYNGVDMSNPPGHVMLLCKLQKGSLTDAKRSQLDIENLIQIGGSGICS